MHYEQTWHTHTYMYTYLHAYMHKRTDAKPYIVLNCMHYKYARVHTNIHTPHTHTHVYTYIHRKHTHTSHTCTAWTNACTHAFITYTPTCTCIDPLSHAHTNMHAYAHTCIHTLHALMHALNECKDACKHCIHTLHAH